MYGDVTFTELDFNSWFSSVLQTALIEGDCTFGFNYIYGLCKTL